MTLVLEGQSLADAPTSLPLHGLLGLPGDEEVGRGLLLGHFWPWDEGQGKNWKKVRTSTLLMRGRRLLENDSSNMGDKAFHPVSLPHLSRDPNLTSPNNLPPPHP